MKKIEICLDVFLVNFYVETNFNIVLNFKVHHDVQTFLPPETQVEG